MHLHGSESKSELVSILRDCEATQIPIGTRIRLPQGTKVKITQSLGGSYTVVTEEGYMVQIAGGDADALGKEVLTKTDARPQVSDRQSVEEMVWNQLRTCYDPEIPVNIVDLGLIYACQVTPLPEGNHRVEVKMTLTAPGCGMGASIAADAQRKILSITGVKEANVEVVWDPPWDQSKMSDAAKLRLGML